MTSLKQKTIRGLSWSFTDAFARYGLTFFLSIILARLLSPADFGLVGMTTIFFAISRTLIDSGFGEALIRKTDASEIDLSSVFYLNIFLGFIFFIIIFFSAVPISKFLNEPRLTDLVRVISIGLVIGSFSSIQRTIITKRIDFKLQARISIISTTIAGIIAITLAYRSFGVWSLVISSLIGQSVTTLLLWWWNQWRPKWVFSYDSLKKLFSFSSKLLVSRLINDGFKNIYYLVIGKYFSATELGYYTRADRFQKLPSENLTSIVHRVTYPVLSSIQSDTNQLKAVYSKLIRSTMFISFVSLIGMAASAESMVVALIGEKWLPSVVYLQMLCFVGMFYPLHAMNLNMLNVLGRSDLFLKLEIIKKILIIPTIIFGVIWGIKIMIFGMMVNTLIATYLNSFWSGRKIGYSTTEQISDIIPSFLLALLMGILVYLVGFFMQGIPAIVFMVQLIFGITFTVIISEITEMRDYIFIKKTLFEQINKIRK